MKKIKLKIRIGKVAVNLLKNNEFAHVEICGIFIPHGNELKGQFAIIDSPNNLTTYVYDWFDILIGFKLSLDLISAEIFLNTKSNHKVFNGEQIVEFLKKLEKKKIEEIYTLRSFNI